LDHQTSLLHARMPQTRRVALIVGLLWLLLHISLEWRRISTSWLVLNTWWYEKGQYCATWKEMGNTSRLENIQVTHNEVCFGRRSWRGGTKEAPIVLASHVVAFVVTALISSNPKSNEQELSG
jgi:hypothetical protein